MRGGELKSLHSAIFHILPLNDKGKLKVKVIHSCPTLSDPMDYKVHGILQARTLEWVAFPFPKWIFPTQGLIPGLPQSGWILYQLSHQGSPRILEWVAYPFSSRSSWPRNWTGVSCIAGRFFTHWAIRYPIVAIPIYMPTNSIRRFLFFTPSLAFTVCRILRMTILTGVRW